MFKFGVKLFTDAYEIYKELNPNTLSGAIDVIVVEQPDGRTLKSTPFYVRFGKMGVLRTKQKSIDIEVNDQPFTAVKMVLDYNGDGYFVENETLNTDTCSNRAETPLKLKNVSNSCPDLISAVSLITPSESSTSIDKNSNKVMKSSSKKKVKKLSVQRISKMLNNESKIRKISWVYGSYNGRSVKGIIHINQDLQNCGRSTAEVAVVNRTIPNSKDKISIFSDSELSDQSEESEDTALESSDFAISRTSPPLEICKPSSAVDQLASCSLPAAYESLITSSTNYNAVKPANGIFKKFADINFSEISRLLFQCPVSVCGRESPSTISLTKFQENRATLDTFVRNPDHLFSYDLVIQLVTGYFDFTVAIPILIKALVFSKTITDDFVAKLCHNKRPLVIQQKIISKDIQFNTTVPSGDHSSWFPWRLSNFRRHPTNNELLQKSDSSSFIPGRSASPDFSDKNQPVTHPPDLLKKSSCLSSDALKKMNLKYDEPNTVKFSVTTKYQGTCACQCSVFVWKWYDKIVISDIDGTITKSDVLGHVMPLVGHQWDQPNVVDLFKSVNRNGYRLIYLSARAIGQSQYTKEYLKSVKQNGQLLPDGPLLLSPSSLFGALHREVIEKKPEVFKIDCLLKIKTLFPSSVNPFYAGFGNKTTDEITYKSCGIHSGRIFNIDPSGRVNFLDRKLSATYKSISELVDQIFPARECDAETTSLDRYDIDRDFTNFCFWRPSFAQIS